MKKVVKIFGLLIVAVYMVVAVFLTVCLLNYNKYHITELGKKSLIIVSDDDLEPKYVKNDLVVVYKNNNEDIKSGDYVFFYNAYQNQVSVNLGKIIKSTRVNEKEYTYTLEGNLEVSSQYVIGKSETSKAYSNMGLVLKVLESRLGFLLIIILPILVLFIYQIYAVILEVKRPVNE
ncbi:MAG: hypothetical protein MR266_02460 [Erysipelotrichaceae bacterium]|nr:hypothetical protein [Erysipelotrichaceae bacterium]